MPKQSGYIKMTFLADTHLGFDYPIRPRLNRRRRGDDFFTNYRTILDHAKTHADLLIHGGDMFYKSRVHEKIVDMAYEPLLELADSGVPIFIVPGNHERSALPTSLLLNHKNIYVFDTPKTFLLEVNGRTIALSGFPFQRGDIRNSIHSLLKHTDYDQHRADLKLLCLHQAIEGATVGPSDFTFRYGKDTIRIADIPTDFNAVLSGHIHRFQILNKENGADNSMPIIYPGSIERTAFAEKMDDKGFVELDCSHNGVEKINFIKLPARPMYDINIDQADSIGSLNSLVAAAISDFDKEAVIRIKLGPEIGEKIKKQVTSAFLRGIFPQTMNVQLSGDFGSNIKKYAGSRNHNQSIVARIRKEAPNSAGVYLFKGDNQIVIYVGKSVNLKQRMASYFYENSKPVETRIQQMVFSIRDFAFIETGTELLALILEDQLIKKHLPAYNIKQKEFKEYRYLLLTNDTFPTLKIITHDDAPNRAGDIFGPFKDEYFVRDLLDIIYRRLNLRQCQEHEPVQRSINYELGLCTGPCRGKIGAQDYAVIAQRVSDFLNGDEKHLFEILSRAMGDFAASLEYEKAADVKREIEFCQKFCKRQRFLHQFKTSKLTIEKNSGATERYTLMKGVLSSAKFNGADIPPLGFDTYTTEHSDARYILDRANIVYNWLNRSTDIVCTWH